MSQRSSQQFSLTIYSEIKFRREKERHQFFRGEIEDESRVRSRESSEKIGKKRESRQEKRSGEQRREKAAESHIQTATGDGECTSHFVGGISFLDIGMRLSLSFVLSAL